MKSSSQYLHDRATRGEVLSADEQSQLDAWYAEINRQETQILFGQDEAPTFEAWQAKTDRLQQQIDGLLNQITISSATLQEMYSQNKVLRTTVDELHAKLIEQTLLEPA